MYIKTSFPPNFFPTFFVVLIYFTTTLRFVWSLMRTLSSSISPPPCVLSGRSCGQYKYPSEDAPPVCRPLCFRHDFVQRNLKYRRFHTTGSNLLDNPFQIVVSQQIVARQPVLGTAAQRMALRIAWQQLVETLLYIAVQQTCTTLCADRCRQHHSQQHHDGFPHRRSHMSSHRHIPYLLYL